MTDGSRRLVGAGCFLAALWILVYWLWQPARPAVSFAREHAAGDPPPALEQAGDEPPAGGPPADPGAVRGVRDPLDGGEGPATPGQLAPAPPAPPTLPDGPDVSQPPPSVPLFRDYVIRDDDTFESIALREMGSRRHAAAIARANPLKDPRRLREGDVIRLPLDPANIQGGPGEADLAPVQQAVQDGWVTYLIEQDDTLSGISRLFYGTTRHAELIYQANRDQLRSINDVRAGQVIRIPPKPE